MSSTNFVVLHRRRDQARQGYLNGLKGLGSVAIAALATVVCASSDLVVAMGTIYCVAMGLGSAGVLVVDGMAWASAAKRLKSAEHDRVPEARLLR